MSRGYGHELSREAIAPGKITGVLPDLALAMLPWVRLSVEGNVFSDRGSTPFPWSIRAEAETESSARTAITINSELLADITIHQLPGKDSLTEEVQAVGAAILWSGMRSLLIKRSRAAKP